jgi:hypothetical protein
MAGEERDREGQHENAPYAHRPRPVKQLIDDEMPDARAPPAFINGDGSELREVLPHNVQRATSGNGVVGGRLGDGELEDVFVKVHRVLLEQPSRPGVLIDQRADFRYVAGARLPHYVLHRGTTVALNCNRTAATSTGAAARKALRLATAPSRSGIGDRPLLPQSGQSARPNTDAVRL